MSSPRQAPAFEGLLYTVFQRLRHAAPDSASGLVVAFTSANPGEGVTHTIHALLAGLAREPETRTLLADSLVLRNLTVHPADLPGLCRALPATGETLFELTSEEPAPASEANWQGSWEYRRDCLQQLRAAFDYVLIDCPALRESNDLLSLAPFADGSS